MTYDETNYRSLPEIENIGKIDPYELNYYDGVIDGCNNDYFITQIDEKFYSATVDEGGIEVDEHTNISTRFYLVYKMDSTFKEALSAENKLGQEWETTSLARYRAYAKTLQPIGWLEEGNWECVRHEW